MVVLWLFNLVFLITIHKSVCGYCFSQDFILVNITYAIYNYSHGRSARLCITEGLSRKDHCWISNSDF